MYVSYCRDHAPILFHAVIGAGTIFARRLDVSLLPQAEATYISKPSRVLTMESTVVADSFFRRSQSHCIQDVNARSKARGNQLLQSSWSCHLDVIQNASQAETVMLDVIQNASQAPTVMLDVIPNA